MGGVESFCAGEAFLAPPGTAELKPHPPPAAQSSACPARIRQLQQQHQSARGGSSGGGAGGGHDAAAAGLKTGGVRTARGSARKSRLRYFDSDGTVYAFRARRVWSAPAQSGSGAGELRDQKGALGRIPEQYVDKLKELALEAGVQCNIPSEAERRQLTGVMCSQPGKRPIGKGSPKTVEEIMHEKSDVPRLHTLKALWENVGSEEYPKIFNNLHITEDGGLGRGDLSNLWCSPGIRMKRIVKASQVLGLCVFNVASLLILDGKILMGDDAAAHIDKFTLSGWLLQSLGSNFMGQKAVVSVELLLLTVMLLNVVRCSVCSLFLAQEWARWHHTALLCWSWIPMLSAFSAMRLLAYVNPFVFLLNIQLAVGYMQDRFNKGLYRSGVAFFAWHLLSRSFCLVIGLDGFLVKFRATSRYVDQSELSITNVAFTLVFMFQVLGVTNLTRFSRKRLNIFIFGGADGKLSNREKGVNFFWNAALAQRLRARFSLLEFVAIMMSFDDFDFQRLVLHSDAHLKLTSNVDV